MEESRESPPAEHGFYMPAEWEPHAQTWIGWPVNPSLSLSLIFSTRNLSFSISDFFFLFHVYLARNLCSFDLLSSFV